MKSRASSNWVVNSSVMMPSLKPLVSMVESAASRETAAAASDSFRQFRLVRLVCIILPCCPICANYTLALMGELRQWEWALRDRTSINVQSRTVAHALLRRTPACRVATHRDVRRSDRDCGTDGGGESVGQHAGRYPDHQIAEAAQVAKLHE